MKKILAFLTAFMLFIAVAAVLHFAASKGLSMNNKDFGFWVNSYKDASYSAITLNLGKNSVPLLGSSEFHHGKRTKYHPSNVFRRGDKDLMIIGSPYTQCLFHATLIGAIEPEMKRKEVIMLVSPSWFKAKGIDPRAFAVRFSESEYLAFLSNDKLSKSLKKRVAVETENKLGTYPDMQKRVHRYNSIFLWGNGNPGDLLYTAVRRVFVGEVEKTTVNTALKVTKIKRYKRWRESKLGGVNDDTKRYIKSLGVGAAIYAKKRSGNNPFFMDDKLYEKKIKPKEAAKREAAVNLSAAKSPEFNDLKIFLEVCRETGVRAKLVLLPTNAYWYDFTGFRLGQREVIRDRILALANDYDVPVRDLSGKEYSKYFFRDAVHPSAKGWIKIDEAINKLY